MAAGPATESLSICFSHFLGHFLAIQCHNFRVTSPKSSCNSFLIEIPHHQVQIGQSPSDRGKGRLGTKGLSLSYLHSDSYVASWLAKGNPWHENLGKVSVKESPTSCHSRESRSGFTNCCNSGSSATGPESRTRLQTARGRICLQGQRMKPSQRIDCSIERWQCG